MNYVDVSIIHDDARSSHVMDTSLRTVSSTLHMSI